MVGLGSSGEIGPSRAGWAGWERGKAAAPMGLWGSRIMGLRDCGGVGSWSWSVLGLQGDSVMGVWGYGAVGLQG